MAIPETQLETWSHQGSIKQSSGTYNTIKSALQSSGSLYAGKDYEVFLQGSYGNDTNIYAESDVDIVIQLNSMFYYDIEGLSENQKIQFREAFEGSADYAFFEFKRDVLALLKETYGDSVKPGNKAIKIDADGNRRKADVIVATEFRRYDQCQGAYNENCHTGICFFKDDRTRIANYPKQHLANCTAKHQATGQWFKPMVRILKNMRGKLVSDGIIEDGLAPSYYIEGLLYNVPDDRFGKNYQDSFVNCINWILQADRTQFECANGLYYLLRENSPVTWRDSKCTEFLNAIRVLWEQW